MKIGVLRAELFCADKKVDGQTRMMKIIVAFRYFAKAPQK